MSSLPAESSSSTSLEFPETECNVSAAYRRLVAFATMILVGLTGRLWIPQTEFPRIPLLQFAVNLPDICHYLALGVLLAGAGIILFAKRLLAVSIGQWLVVVGFAGAFLLDQHRLQVWAWQFFIVMMTYIMLSGIMLSGQTRVSACRAIAISIYFFSAVSKIDQQFVEGIGQQLLAGLFSVAHLDANTLSESWRQLLTLCMPLGELAVACLLMFSKTRKIGFWSSLLMHGMLLLMFSPLGLNHSWGVLGWNVFFIAQNIILWSPFRLILPQATSSQWQFKKLSNGQKLRVFIVGVLILAPIGEWFGRYDHWLGWAVYSERAEKVLIYINQNEVDRLPESLQSCIGKPSYQFDWCRLDADRWSFQTLGVPQYPQLRVELAVAKAMEQRFGLEGKMLIQVEQRRVPRWRFFRDSFSSSNNKWKKTSQKSALRKNYDSDVIDDYFSKTLWNTAPCQVWNAEKR